MNPLVRPALPEVVVQRPGDETEHGPFGLQQAAEAVARGTFALTDDARLRHERRWGKLGEILADHGVPIPNLAPRLWAATEPPGEQHPLLASVLGLGVKQLYGFFLKVWIAWWLAGLTLLSAAFLLASVFAMVGWALGLTVFEWLLHGPRR